MVKGSSNYYAEKIEREREWKCALWQMQLHAFVYGTHTPTHTLIHEPSDNSCLGTLHLPLSSPPRPSHSTTFGTCKQFSVIIDNKYNICIALSRVATAHSLTASSHTQKERERKREQFCSSALCQLNSAALAWQQVRATAQLTLV